MEDKRKKITIIIPVYNEELAVGEVIDEIAEEFEGSEIIVVNDGSTDKTAQILEKVNVKVINHEKNRGLGAALKTGIKHATNDIIITIDADGEHLARSAKDILKNVEIFDMVVGKRVNSTNNKLYKKTGKKILILIANILVGFKIPDINSGLRIYKKKVIERYLRLLSDGFSFSTTSTLVMLFNNHKIRYEPVCIQDRKGNSKVTLNAGIASLKNIFFITLIFKPVRIILFIMYSLLIVLLIIQSFFFREIPSPNSILIYTLCILVISLVDVFSRCDKKLISASNDLK